MISTAEQITRARRFCAQYAARGVNFLDIPRLITHPAGLSPEELFEICQRTDCELGTLLSHGIGVNNKVEDLQRYFTVTGTHQLQEF